MATRPSRGSIVCAMASTILLLAMLPGIAVSQDEPVVFRIGTTQTATETGLNPFLATAGMDYTLITDVYDLLIEFGPDLEPAPGLAETWDQSDDGLTWTYTIRDGVTWHDGEPLTAEDIAFTFNYIRSSQDPEYQGPAAPDGNDLAGAEEEGQDPEPDGSADNPISLYDNALDLDGGFENTRIESVEAPDESTVVITTSEPLIVLSQIYIPIVPQHVWETIPYAQAANDFANEEPVGSGPFMLREFDPDQFWRFEANQSYWAGAPKIDELVYQYFENDEASVAALQSGDVDLLTSVPPTLVSTLEGDANVTVHRAPSSDLAELGFNSWDPDAERFAAEGCADCPKGPTTGSMGDPWLTRAEVRAALAQLVDKQGLVDRALNGFGTPGVSLVGPFNEQYHYEAPADDPATYPGSPEVAKERLDSVMTGLGFSDTDGNGILNVPDTADARAFDPEGAGKDWSLRLFVRDDDEEDKVAGELIEAAFEEAGVDVDRQLVKEDPALYDATYPSSTNADMDMYIWGWGPDPDPDFILSVFACDQINNWQDVNYCDPEYDDLYRQSRVATDLAARQDIVRGLQAKAYTEAPYAVLWYVDTLEAYRSDRWEGFQEHPAGKGSFWSTWGFGPYGSKITVAPIGAAVESPGPSAQPGTPSPGESAGGSASPAPAPTATPGGGGSGTGDTALLVGAAAVVVLGALGLFLFARRRSAREEE